MPSLCPIITTTAGPWRGERGQLSSTMSHNKMLEVILLEHEVKSMGHIIELYLKVSEEAVFVYQRKLS